MSQAFIAPHPRCPEHGQMNHRVPLPGEDSVLPGGRYVCHGWDGEGCAHTVADKDLDWRPLGEAEGISLGWTPWD